MNVNRRERKRGKMGKRKNAEQRMMNKTLIMSVMAKDMTLMKKNFEEHDNKESDILMGSLIHGFI